MLLLFAAALLSGCSGGARASTWTGLVIDDGVVYVADLTHVRAFDAESGAQVWTFPRDESGGGPFYTATIQPGEALFVTSEEKASGLFSFAQARNVLRALTIDPNDPDGRRELWAFDAAEGTYVSGGAVSDNLLVIGNGDGNVYALNTESGAMVWTFTTENRIWAKPLVVSDTVYVSSLDHHLYALDVENGRPRWEQPFQAGGAIAGQPLVYDGLLYVGAFDNKVYALQQEDGTVVWEAEGQNWFWGTPTTDGSAVYAADVNGNVYAWDAATGSLVWDEHVDDLVHIGPALSQDHHILVVAGSDGSLYGLDTSDGVVLWEQPGEGEIASMVIDGDYVYISRIASSDSVQAFYAENGRNLWTFSSDS